jgi:hypothetical protein
MTCYNFADIPELVFMETRPRPNLTVETIYFTDCIASWDDVGVSLNHIYQILKYLIYYLMSLPLNRNSTTS